MGMALDLRPTLKPNGSTSSTGSNTLSTGSSSGDDVLVVSRIQDQTDFTGPPVDNYFIQYDSSTQKFVMSAVDTVSAGGSTTQVQYNSSGSFAGSSGLTWDNTTSLLGVTGKQTITSNSSSAILMSIKGASGQSGNYLQCKDNSDNVFFAVQSDKSLLIPPASTIGNTQSLTWKTDGSQWGNAELHIQRDRTSNNGLGTQLKLTDNGVSAYIKFFSRSFTQAVNDLEFWSQGGLNISMPYTGGTYIYNPVTNSQYPALLTAPAQTIAVGGGAPSPIGAFVFEQITYSATSANSVTDAASLLIKGSPIQGTNMTIGTRYGALILTGSATAKGAVVRGASSQTANLQEWQNNSSTVLSAVHATGAFQPASMADSSAAVNTIYYSTTQNKLVYKDSSSVVNNLY